MKVLTKWSLALLLLNAALHFLSVNQMEEHSAFKGTYVSIDLGDKSIHFLGKLLHIFFFFYQILSL